MNNRSLAGAAAVVLIANGFALLHATRNRSGEPDSEVMLTNRELRYFPDGDNSGVSLHLNWLSPAGEGPFRVWLDRDKLRALGFDCSVDPSAATARRFYERQRPRTAYVALEYDGPAWRAFVDDYSRYAGSGGRNLTPYQSLDDIVRSESHLVPIDAALDPAPLRAKHPDRHSVVIVPAVISVSLIGRVNATAGGIETPPRLTGSLDQIPAAIHVPRPFSENFQALPKDSTNVYRVHLRYGKLLDPSVAAVEFGPQ